MALACFIGHTIIDGIYPGYFEVVVITIVKIEKMVVMKRRDRTIFSPHYRSFVCDDIDIHEQQAC